MLHWKVGKYYLLNHLVLYSKNRSSVLMSVSYLYARNRKKWEKEKLFQGLLEGEEVGALCSSHVCEPPSPLNPEPHETSDSEHITQYKILILMLMLS